MRRRRDRQRKIKEEPTLFTKPVAQVTPNKTKRQVAKVVPDQAIEVKQQTMRRSYDDWSKAVKVADIIADYINPAIYILFSLVYFFIGMIINIY